MRVRGVGVWFHFFFLEQAEEFFWAEGWSFARILGMWIWGIWHFPFLFADAIIYARWMTRWLVVMTVLVNYLNEWKSLNCENNSGTFSALVYDLRVSGSTGLHFFWIVDQAESDFHWLRKFDSQFSFRILHELSTLQTRLTVEYRCY